MSEANQHSMHAATTTQETKAYLKNLKQIHAGLFVQYALEILGQIDMSQHEVAWCSICQGEFAKCCLADFLSPFAFMAVPESSAWLCLQFQLAVSACSLNGISNAHTFNVQHPTSNSLQIAGFQGLPESQAGATGMGYRGVWGLGCESNAGNPSGAGHLE